MTAVAPTHSDTPPAAARPEPAKKPRDWYLVGLWISLGIFAVLWFVPFIIMFFTSVKTNMDATATAPWLPPTDWAWENFPAAVEDGNLWVTGMNSLIVAAIKVPVGLAIAAAAAFALSRIKFSGAKLLLGIFVLGSMVPVQIALGPLFNTMLSLDLLDSRTSLILPYLAFGIPYQIFILHGFFKGIPHELEEAARIDGASTFRVFWQICMPLALPAFAALFILDFVATWNEYAIAQTMIQSQSNWTIPLAVQGFSTQYATQYGTLNAFIIMSAVPVLIVYLMFQRYFVSGALAGAVKS